MVHTQIFRITGAKSLRAQILERLHVKGWILSGESMPFHVPIRALSRVAAGLDYHLS